MFNFNAFFKTFGVMFMWTSVWAVSVVGFGYVMGAAIRLVSAMPLSPIAKFVVFMAGIVTLFSLVCAVVSGFRVRKAEASH